LREAYTKRTYRPRVKDPVDKFYSRLHVTLQALQKIQKQLPRETFARFARAYSQHWLYSVEHGEQAAAPGNYYNEWAESESLGTIPMNSDTSAFHNARNYHVYESPRETARKVLGGGDSYV
jgi:hypothetical protein